jgi:hypothetical protein
MKCLSEKFFCCALSLVLLSLAVVAKAQDTQTRRDIFEPFDRCFDSIPLERERMSLDNFAIALLQNPDSIGYIVVYAGKDSCVGEAQSQANRMKKYVVEYRKIAWNRVIAKDGGYFERSMVILQPIPRDQLSTQLFTYYPATEEHVVRRCKERKSTRKRRSRL